MQGCITTHNEGGNPALNKERQKDMKKLINAVIIIIQLFIALGCVGAFDNGTMSFVELAIGILTTVAITYMCFHSMEKESKNEKV